MRKQLVESVEKLIDMDERVMLLLGDIGVHGFRNAFQRHPKRVINIGILEQSTIGVAAGFSILGFIPIFHTIAPFIVERAYEQLKVDFGYQKLGGNFISVGASYDYAALGSTHHAPGDIGVLLNIPGMEIVVPGTAAEFNRLLEQGYDNGHPTYYRLSEKENSFSFPVTFGQAEVIKSGKDATVVAIGPLLEVVIAAVEGFDVTVLYYTTLSPFDAQTLINNVASSKILLCEPFYEGSMTGIIMSVLFPQPVAVTSIGVPKRFLLNYGTRQAHDDLYGFTIDNIKSRLELLISGKY